MKHIPRPYIWIFTCVAVCSAAESVNYAAELNRVPAGCRLVAMGNAAAALPGHAMACSYNPGLAAFAESREIRLEGAKLYGGISDFGALAGIAPMQADLALGVLYAGLLSGDIEQYDSLPGTHQQRLYSGVREYKSLGVFHNNHHAIGVTIAKKLGLPVPRPEGFTAPIPVDVGAGVNFRYYWQTMTPADKVRMGMNVNMDVGAALRIGVDYDLHQQQPSRELIIGAAVQDVLPTRVIWLHSYENYEELVERTVYSGIAYCDNSGIFWADWVISLAVHRQYATTLHIGIEALVWDLVAIRLGLSNKTPSFGAGVQTRFFTVDYACSFDEINATPLRLGLGFTF